MKIQYTELLGYKQHVYYCAWLVSLFCFCFFTVQWLSSPSTLPCLLSAPSVVYPARPALFCCGQIREPKITADYPAHRIATQLQAAEHRAGFSLWKCAQHRPFKKNPEGPAAITPGKCHRKGIYFMSYTRQDNQHLFRKATDPSLCERTATASPLNLLMHCTK